MQIINSSLDREASLIGAIQLINDTLFMPATVDELVGALPE
ncbi:hypothetical protein [Paraburkholderia susongensis]|nr:hypothetical protein [Paraburkholderia susongensis]